MFVFVLECQNNKYFVGKTEDPDFTVTKYLSTSKQPSKFTTENKPIKVAELIPNCDAYDVNKYTKRYMAKYGIHNVQGGSYVGGLDENDYLAIQRELDFANKKCLVCGDDDHDSGTCEEFNLEGVELTHADCTTIHGVLTKLFRLPKGLMTKSLARIATHYIPVIERRISLIDTSINYTLTNQHMMFQQNDSREKQVADYKKNRTIYKKIIDCIKELSKLIENNDLEEIDNTLQKICKYKNLLLRGEIFILTSGNHLLHNMGI